MMVTPYVPVTVSSATLLSARFMNSIEQMWPDAKTYIDIHVHDDRYYPKAISDARFFSVGQSIADADKIQGLHFSDLIGGILPKGIVFGWNGTDADIPTGWHILDGSYVNGLQLPDPRGKFILPAGTTQPHTTGGTDILNDAGGDVTAQGHILTLSEIPNHYHNWQDTWGGGTATIYSNSGSGLTSNTQTLARTTAQNHAGIPDTAHDHGLTIILFAPFSIIPLYFSKYLICKVI